jgi:bifunctional N-acetylglucosamine-1-phosphate-uridyltransferase/glucosamine-1-phosphate-acetyltransferase GlmU-like protein
LSSNNSQNEYYLTDVIEIIKREEKIEIGLLELESDKNYEIIGVNTIEQLQDLETTLQNIIQ